MDCLDNKLNKWRVAKVMNIIQGSLFATMAIMYVEEPMKLEYLHKEEV